MLESVSKKVNLGLLLMFLFLALPFIDTISAQETLDLNRYYRFPLSVGVQNVIAEVSATKRIFFS